MWVNRKIVDQVCMGTMIEKVYYSQPFSRKPYGDKGCCSEEERLKGCVKLKRVKEYQLTEKGRITF